MLVFIMAYTPTYNSDDTSPIAIDLLGGILVSIGSFAGLIGLVFLYRWAKGKKLF